MKQNIPAAQLLLITISILSIYLFFTHNMTCETEMLIIRNHSIFINVTLSEETQFSIDAHRDWRKTFETLVSDRNGPPFAYHDPRTSNVHVLSFNRHLVHAKCACFGANYERLGDNKSAKFTAHRKDMPGFEAVCDCPEQTESVQLNTQTAAEVYSLAKVNKIVNRFQAWSQDPIPKDEEVAICVAPLYGNGVFWALILQFVEIHRALGAGRIFIYYLNIDDPAAKALLYFYTAIEPLLELIPLHPKESECGSDWACRQDFAIQDCLLRARLHTYRHVIPIDIDELIIPLEVGQSLTDLIQSIAKSDAHSYMLRQRWIFRTTDEVQFQNSNLDPFNALPYNRFHSSTRVGPVTHTSKCVVNLDSALYMGVHRMVAAKSGTKEYPVSPQAAYIRHYRNPNGWGGYEEVKQYGPITNTSLPVELAGRVNRRAVKVIGFISQLLELEE